jgi:hypothetical protein
MDHPETPTPTPPAPLPPLHSRDDFQPTPRWLPGLFVRLGIGLVGGIAGAFVYEKWVAPQVASLTKPETPAAPPVDQPKPPEYASASDVAKIKADLADVRGDVDTVTKRVEAIPDPQPIPDLANLRSKAEDVTRQTEAIARQSEQIRYLEAKIMKLEEAVNKSAASAEVKPTAAPNSNAGLANVNASIATVNVFFDQRKYAEALKLCRDLEESMASDARVWYYAALATGFTTNDWRGEAERLVKMGIDREKAGTPNRTMIDDEFADLTAETGKDWLAGWRKRAQ